MKLPVTFLEPVNWPIGVLRAASSSGVKYVALFVYDQDRPVTGKVYDLAAPDAADTTLIELRRFLMKAAVVAVPSTLAEPNG